MTKTTETCRVQTTFGGWIVVTKETALGWASHKLRAITTMKSDEERLEYINSKLDGVQFSLTELRLASLK